MGKYGMSKRGHTPKWDYPSWSTKTKGFFKGGNTSPMEDFVGDFWDEQIVPRLPWDWNDYRSMQDWSTKPFIGGIFDKRMKEMKYAEEQRYWSDKAHYMGFDLDDVSYPISTGIYGSPVGPGDYFEATESVIGLFAPSLLKWM